MTDGLLLAGILRIKNGGHGAGDSLSLGGEADVSRRTSPSTHAFARATVVVARCAGYPSPIFTRLRAVPAFFPALFCAVVAARKNSAVMVE